MKSFARKLKSMKAFSPHRLGLLAFVFALTLLGSKADAQNGWITAPISLLYVDSTGSLNLYLGTTTPCGSSHLIYIHSIIGNDDAKAMLAALLAWQAQGLQVSVYLKECVSGYGQFDAAYSGSLNGNT